MGRVVNCWYEPDDWGDTLRENRPGPYRAYIPDRLMDGISITPEAISAAAAAEVDIALIGRRSHFGRTTNAARLVLRTEALGSSRIEGLSLPIRKLLEYEELRALEVTGRRDGKEQQVIASVDALVDALKRHGKGPLSLEEVCEVNTALLAGSPLEGSGGILRTDQNWIGGMHSTPVNALYVPPPPEYVPALMSDLVGFVNTSQLPAVAVASIAHVQFESIHPFADGNGRTGRVLIQMVLSMRGISAESAIPFSAVMAADKESYLAALRTFQGVVGDVDASEWVTFCARSMQEACARIVRFDDALTRTCESWKDVVCPRSGSAAALILDYLPAHPVLSARTASDNLKLGLRSVQMALRQLSEAGIVRMAARNKKSGLYVCDSVLEQLTILERSLVPRSGNN